MKITLRVVPVSELIAGFRDDNEGGVTGYAGRLDIRPPYQREFVYGDKQRKAVIETLTKDFPLNVMYWADRGDGTFEVIDGQQRTISICQYVAGDFSISNANGDPVYFHSLQDDQKAQVLGYGLSVYVCTGTDSEKLDWFRTINIAGEKLTDQELRNAVYSGTWVTDAKKYFSKSAGPAHQIGSDYLSGSAIRQDYLETAIRWISKDAISEYMTAHQHDKNALDLWTYFQTVMTWVRATFPKNRKEMKGLPWGPLWEAHHTEQHDAAELEKRIAELMADDEIQAKKGIYSYVLDGQEKHLNLRSFTDKQKREAFERQEGVCPKCDHDRPHQYEEMQGDHIVPWSKGGKTTAENCQMLCQPCNGRKSNH